MDFKKRVMKQLQRDDNPAEEVQDLLMILEEEKGKLWNKATKNKVKELIKHLGKRDVNGSMKMIQGMILKGHKVYDEKLVTEHLPKYWRILKGEK